MYYEMDSIIFPDFCLGDTIKQCFLEAKVEVYTSWQQERQTDGVKSPTLVFIVYELHCAHIPHINRVYCYWLRAVVEQENTRIFTLNILGIYSGGNQCPATLCKCLHYRVILLEMNNGQLKSVQICNRIVPMTVRKISYLAVWLALLPPVHNTS